MLISSCFNTAQASKKIYRWKDATGNWVFSDIPREGAEEVRLNSNALTMPRESTAILNETVAPANISYKVIIASPKPEETIRENSGSVYVNARIEPSFSPGLLLQLFIDGNEASPKQSSTTFALRDVPRGEHSVVIKLFNAEGQQLAASSAVVFFMHRASSLNKP
ncbi:DUF4124 domain-containing protein [Pseudoalteromonas fenneropenaei]|uniref:DUF4124 domain-containing protein n=1 Tax=Pseudoalteromonas fenneropenaei TaxID=1737459 RepID=A0ABV7CNT4_9GAMM